MENRFGIRDLIIAALLVVLIVSVWVSMKQSDRELEQIQRIGRRVEDQSAELRKINQTLATGVAVESRGGSAHGGPQGVDPFARVRAAQAMPDYAPGDWSVDVFGVAVGKLTPLVSTDVYQSAVEGSVLESLAIRDPKTLEWTPFIAEAWTIADHREKWRAFIEEQMKAPLTEELVRQERALPFRDAAEADLTAERRKAQSDYVADRLKAGQAKDRIIDRIDAPPAMTIDFVLRKNVRFSDGAPLTSGDVVYTYNLIMNPKIAAPRLRAYYDKVQGVDADGDHRVSFRLKEPYFLGFNICAGLGIMSQRFYGEFSEDQINQMPGLLFGSGPYMLRDNPREWKPGEGTIILVRNDRYWGVSPALDRIVYRELSEEVARLVAFRNGETDQFRPTPEQYLTVKNDQDLLERNNLIEYETPTGGYRYIAWNQERNGKPTRFADQRVRRALTLLSDREEMCERLMVGLATPTSGPFHHLGEQDDPGVKPWPYDPAEARRLLREAGFADRDGDKVIEGPDGQPFRFKLIYPSSSINYQQMAFYLKDAYAQAGIALEPDPLEWTIMLQRIDQRDYDAMSLGWGGTVESDVFQMFHSSQIGDGGDNYTHYANPELDRAIEEARTTLDDARRNELWHTVHRVLHEDQPYTFLWTSRGVTFVNKRMQNVQVTRIGLNSETEWFVPTRLQKWGK